jgi:aconitase A
VAAAAYFIVTNMVNPAVYAAAGLDVDQAVEAAKTNEHRKTMLRASSRHLMDFLAEVGLLTRPAMAIYRRISML